MVTREELMGLRKTQLAGAVIQCGWKPRRKDLTIQQDALTSQTEGLINHLLIAQDNGAFDLFLNNGQLVVKKLEIDEQTAATMARVEVEDEGTDEETSAAGAAQAAEAGETEATEAAAEETGAGQESTLQQDIQGAEEVATEEPQGTVDFRELVAHIDQMVGQGLDGLREPIADLAKQVSKLAKSDLTKGLAERMTAVETTLASLKGQLDRIENIGLWLYSMTDDPRPSSFFQTKPGMCLEPEEMAAEDAAAATQPVQQPVTPATAPKPVPAAPQVSTRPAPVPAVPKVAAPVAPKAAEQQPVRPPVAPGVPALPKLPTPKVPGIPKLK